MKKILFLLLLYIRYKHKEETFVCKRNIFFKKTVRVLRKKKEGKIEKMERRNKRELKRKEKNGMIKEASNFSTALPLFFRLLLRLLVLLSMIKPQHFLRSLQHP